MTTSVTVEIRPVGQNERTAWEPLWQGYLTFYKAALSPEQNDLTWKRLHDPAEPMMRLAPMWTADYRVSCTIYFTARPGRGRLCYLQDLFVADGGRNPGSAAR